MSGTCPICHLSLPLPELDRHANGHFEEDDERAIARDMELAQAIALAPPSPVSKGAFVELSVVPESTDRRFPESFAGTYVSSSTYTNQLHADVQNRDNRYNAQGGILDLLKQCLEKENKDTITVITGYVDHFQSTESEDSGWGCGWRNIQMLGSHLMHRQDAKEVIFGGCGFVPDILSLQMLLEAAWERGFDVPGSEQLGKKVHGTKKWIGTTECAALLRSFGLRARVVDFDSKVNESSGTSRSDMNCEISTVPCNGTTSKRRMIKKPVIGPMDKFLIKGTEPENGYGLASYNSYAQSTSSYDSMDHDNRTAKQLDGHHVLANWVWDHFMDGVADGSDKSSKILVTNKTPLYFQHDGHSRTIVGIQRQKRPRGEPNFYTLLILDPAHRTTNLESCFRQNNGWQQLVKRGSHTLKKLQYQVCYVDRGVAEGQELEQLKTVDSALVKL